ncbi:MAG: serine/threonine-protein kinase [Holophagaceae bacterium]
MTLRIGKFEILRRLGEGAMGEVFLAQDTVIGREVAIKTIRKDSLALGEAKDEARERFYREARAAGGLNHPNLVTVHEFGEEAGLLYLAMEFVPGEDLGALLSRRGLSPRELLEVLAQVCDGLAYAHAKGVLHRDIKPSNIRVASLQGRLLAKVMDFGIARIGGSEMTGTGTLLGTFGYMAPEYIQTGHPTPSVDLFAVGVILYEALAGRRPFVGDTTATVLYRIVHDEPAPLDLTGLPEVSPRLQGIVMQALAKNPQERFASAEALAAVLRGAMDPSWSGPADTLPTQRTPRPEPSPEAATAGRDPAPPAPPRRTGPWLAAAAGFLLLGGGLWAWNRRASASAVLTPAAPVPASSPAVRPSPPASRPAPPEPGASRPAVPVGATPVHSPQASPKSGPPVPAEPPPARAAETAPAPAPAPDEALEAPAHLKGDPLMTLRWSEELLRNFPGNPKATALRIVALYELGRYGEIPGALQVAAASGVPPRTLFRFPRFVRMVQEEARERRLPEPVRAQLGRMQEERAEALPRPPAERRKFRFRN